MLYNKCAFKLNLFLTNIHSHRALSEQDETFQYYADVGVNVYVTAHLSFLPERERRSTRVAARTFCPEFDHHTEFPCELQVMELT